MADQKKIDFDVAKTIKYWLDGALYDLETGKSLIQAKRFPHALFFGHLALEKLLKAIVVKNTKEHAPFTHSLPFLAEKTNIELSEEYKIKLREFMEFRIESRYPDSQKTFYEKCTESYTSGKIKEIEEIFAWLRKQL